MIVERFGLFAVDDPVDFTFDCPICWSRIYEYPFAIDHTGGAVHNTSWGYEGIHIVFKEWLDAHHADVVHSDLRPGRNTEVWDVTTPPPAEWIDRFDTVLSVSALEEIPGDHWQIISQHLYPQLRDGGRLVVTFDLPGFQLAAVKDALDSELQIPEKPLTPRNSPHPAPFGELHVGFLVIRK